MSETQTEQMAVDEVVGILGDVLNTTRLTTNGKRIGRDRYVHSSVLSRMVRSYAITILTCPLKIAADDLVIRVDQAKRTVSLLHYPRFLTLAHPALCCSLRADLNSGRVSRRTYEHSHNRPILHRKELLVAPDHPSYNVFASLTREEIALGLFDEPRRIGWSRFWDNMLAERGIEIVGHEIRNRSTDNR